ncbi:MAG: aminodeoxychorismate lyase [Nitrospirota bacterium]
MFGRSANIYIFLNNRIVAEEEAVVSVYDHGFLYGDGIYETMRSYNGVVFRLEKHIERLNRSASYLKLAIPDKDFIKDAVYKTFAANRLSDAYIRITVSRGKGPVGLDPELCREPTFVVIAEQFRQYPEAYYKNGTKLFFAKIRRNLVAALDPKIKSLNFLNNIMAKIEAKEKGAHEAIMLNADGFIAEGTVSNIFFVKDKMLCTPSVDAGILDGITRETVISLAIRNGIEVREGMFSPDDLFKSTEVFFTNTTAEVMPVSQVDDVKYEVGEMTVKLHDLYREEVAIYSENMGAKG